ncbi:MAG: hypothetical protein R3C02_12040 [Planctomycetaceae bacterium]
MSSYDSLLRIFADHPAGILAACGVALSTLMGLLAIGGWLPLIVIRNQRLVIDPQGAIKSVPAELDLVSLLALTLGGGLILVLTLGTLTAYLLKDVLPGMVLSGLTGLPATVWLMMNLRGKSLRWGTSGRVFAFVTIFAVVMTLWQHTVSEFVYASEEGEKVAYSAMNGDTGFHVYLAIMVRESGLPLRDMYGSPFRDYCAVTHVGHGVLMAGLASVLRVTEYQASTGLWVSASLLLCWSSMSLMIREQLSGKYVLAAGVIPLIFGPLMLPSVLPFLHPQAALVIEPGVANRMYWNLPQAMSTALAAVSLILFDASCRTAITTSGRLKLIVLVAVAIVASGWVKPSLFIFYAPALLVSLVVQRARLIELAASVSVLTVGAVVYLLPAFLVTVPSVPSWKLHPNLEQTIEVARFMVYGCAALLLLAVFPGIRLLRELVHPREPRAITLPLVAMGGSLLFAVLFREEQFVGFVTFQPNIWWGPSACALLLIPLLIQHAQREETEGVWASLVGVTASLLMVLHTLSGFQFALACPAINIREYPVGFAQALKAAQEQTSPGTRFLLDPQLNRVDLAGFLRRPSLYSSNYMFPKDSVMLDEWNQLFDQTADTSGSDWTKYNGAIVSEGSTGVQSALEAHDWQFQPLIPGFQLWMPFRNTGVIPVEE